AAVAVRAEPRGALVVVAALVSLLALHAGPRFVADRGVAAALPAAFELRDALPFAQLFLRAAGPSAARSSAARAATAGRPGVGHRRARRPAGTRGSSARTAEATKAAESAVPARSGRGGPGVVSGPTGAAARAATGAAGRDSAS